LFFFKYEFGHRGESYIIKVVTNAKKQGEFGMFKEDSKHELCLHKGGEEYRLLSAGYSIKELLKRLY